MKNSGERDVIFLKKPLVSIYLIVYIISFIPLMVFNSGWFFIISICINIISLILFTLSLKLKMIRRISFLPSGIIVQKGILLSDFIDYKKIIKIQEEFDVRETVYLYTEDRVYDLGNIKKKKDIIKEISEKIK